MPTITVSPQKGAELIKMSKQNLENGMLKIGRLQIYRMFQAIAKKARVYPDELPNQKYVRTGALSDSVQINYDKNTQSYSISVNPRETRTKRRRKYGRYVKGDTFGQGQARIHQGRWTTLRDDFEEELAKLPIEIVNSLKYAIQRKSVVDTSSVSISTFGYGFGSGPGLFELESRGINYELIRRRGKVVSIYRDIYTGRFIRP